MARKQVVEYQITYKLWEDALDSFLAFKKAQGLRESTLESYRTFISIFFRRYPKAYEDKSSLKTSAIAFLSQDISPSTYNLRYIYLKAFINWGIEEGIFDNNPLKAFKRRKTNPRIIDIPIATLKKLTELPDKKTFAGLRDYSLMLLSLDNGIRPGEAFQLLITDFHFTSMDVYIRPEVDKTNRGRTVPISMHTVKAIKQLIASRDESWNENTPVFCTYEGNSLNRHVWGDRMELYSKRLNEHITPYSLRHCFAIQYLRNGGDVLRLQKIMGHSDLAMTRIYCNITNSDVHEQHELASPIASMFSPAKSRIKKL